MDLKEVTLSSEIADEEIRLWETNDVRTINTRHYVAREGGAEVGFVSVDIDPDCEHFVIYQFFVPPRLRTHGIGSRILKAAEALGKSLGFRKSLLIPHTLANEFSQQDIESWYLRCGYSRLPGDSRGTLTKDLGG